jgi:hypothetical protein
MKTKGWHKDRYQHSLASKGVKTSSKSSQKTKLPKEQKWPEKIYHGTDEYSWNIIQRVGFHEPDPYLKSKYAELGYVYGTTEKGWAEIYAETRAKQMGSKYGVILEIDTKGLDIKYDNTVVIDSLMLQAFSVKLPIGPERVKLFKKIKVNEHMIR